MVLDVNQRVLAIPTENTYGNEVCGTSSTSIVAGEKVVVFDQGNGDFVAYKSGKIVPTDVVTVIPVEGLSELSVATIDYPNWIVNGCYHQQGKGWTINALVYDWGPGLGGECTQSWRAKQNGATVQNEISQSFTVGAYVNRVSCRFWTGRTNGVTYTDHLWDGSTITSVVNCGVSVDGTQVTCDGGEAYAVWGVNWARGTGHTVRAWGNIDWNGTGQSWDTLMYVTEWRTWRV